MKHYQPIRWKAGDRFYIYEGGEKLWGEVVDDPRGLMVNWGGGDQTKEDPISPSSCFWDTPDGIAIKART